MTGKRNAISIANIQTCQSQALVREQITKWRGERRFDFINAGNMFFDVIATLIAQFQYK